MVGWWCWIGDDLHLVSQNGVEKGSCSAIGHVQDVDAGFELEHLGEQMRCGPKPWEPQLILPGLALA